MAKVTKRRRVTRGRRTRRVFLLLGAYYQKNHQGIARYAQEAHWTLDNSFMRIGQISRYTLQLDGVIGLITDWRDLQTLRQLPKLPLVDLSAAWGTEALPDQSGASVPRVLYDNAAIGQRAAEHFIGRGFEHIALFNWGDFWMERERKVTFKAAIQKAGRKFHEIEHYRWHAALSRTHPINVEDIVLRRLESELQKLPKPLAVFAPSDDFGVIVLQACEQARLRVPEEVAVLGCHNDPLACEFAPVPLSSMDDDLDQQGYEAARLLDRLMRGEPAPSAPIIIPPKGIVTRASSDILAVPHREVATALRYIWQHYTEPIRTRDVVGAVPLSRYHLMRLFQAQLGRSISEEITRKRINLAKQLLIETNLKAWQVAQRTGFSSMEHFSNAFTRIVGLAPSHFRKTHLPPEASPTELSRGPVAQA